MFQKCDVALCLCVEEEKNILKIALNHLIAKGASCVKVCKSILILNTKLIQPVQVRNTAWLAETAIYVATVDKLSDVLRAILDWVKENRGQVGQIK